MDSGCNGALAAHAIEIGIFFVICAVCLEVILKGVYFNFIKKKNTYFDGGCNGALAAQAIEIGI